MKMYIPKISDRSKFVVRLVALLLPVMLILPLLTTPAFARTTYVITDGDQVKVHTSFETNPAEVLDEAGVTLGKDDVYTTQPAEDGYEITVQRKQIITIVDCGTEMEVSSYGETLDNLFTRLGIPAYGNYRVSMPLDTETYDGMQVEVDCIIESVQTYTEEIPFEVTYLDDPNLPEGEEVVLVDGKPGQLQTQANVIYKNSLEQSRRVLSQSVVEEPVDTVIARGTAAAEPAQATDAPIISDGVIITADGQRLTYSHTGQFLATAYTHTDAGCDFITATGTTVRIGTVAVDPTVIRYGTRMFIVCNDGSYIYGIATAEDCGGAIKNNRLDLYFPTTYECFQFGVRNCTVYFLD